MSSHALLALMGTRIMFLAGEMGQIYLSQDNFLVTEVKLCFSGSCTRFIFALDSVEYMYVVICTDFKCKSSLLMHVSLEHNFASVRVYCL